MSVSVTRKSLFAGVAALGLQATLPAIAAPLPNVGAWSLETFDEVAKDGTRKPRFGVHPTGLLIYTASGKMSATLSGIDRPTFEPLAESAPLESHHERLMHFLSYAGTYEVKGDRVFHHISVSVFTNLVGTTLEREFHISGDTLTIRTITRGMWGDNSILVWKRA